MCLIVFAWQTVPGMPLIAAANRDEYFARPSGNADWWPTAPHIYAGRDLLGGGTWLGITRDGRFAAITNIRAPDRYNFPAPSRGALVSDYLRGDLNPQDYVASIKSHAHTFHGFNLLIGDVDQLIWFSNGDLDDARNGQPLPPGIYGLSNASLDTPWPKVVRTKAQFASLLFQQAPPAAYFEMLMDTRTAPNCRLPKTGVPLERERMLSAVFIESPDYGTRVSTLVSLSSDKRIILDERNFR